MNDDSTSELFDVGASAEVHSPEPPSTAPNAFNPRASLLANRSGHSTSVAVTGRPEASASPRPAWQSASSAADPGACPANVDARYLERGDDPPCVFWTGAGWAVRPVSHEQSRQRSPAGDSFARAQSATRSPIAAMALPKDNFARAQSSKDVMSTASKMSGPTKTSGSIILSPSRRVALSRDGNREGPRSFFPALEPCLAGEIIEQDLMCQERIVSFPLNH